MIETYNLFVARVDTFSYYMDMFLFLFLLLNNETP